MQLKLNRGILVGDTWFDAGAIIGADGKYAEKLIRSGAAVPLSASPPIESASAPHKGAERATAPRQR